MSDEIKEAIKFFGREDLLNDYGIQDTDTNIEVFLSVKDVIKYYKQGNETDRLNNIINELEKDINNEMMMTRKFDEYNEGFFNATLHFYNKLKELKEGNKQ